jgi:hypothetical protein
MDAGINNFLGFASQNPKLKNGMNAIFEQRKGLKRKYRRPPQPLAVLYLLLCRDPPIGVPRGWGRDRENIWNSLP